MEMSVFDCACFVRCIDLFFCMPECIIVIQARKNFVLQEIYLRDPLWYIWGIGVLMLLDRFP